MAKSKRMKAPEIRAPQTLAEAEQLLATVGKLQRQVETIETSMNEQLASLKADYESLAAPLNERIEGHFQALQAWAEANRGTLLHANRKSTRIATGELGWRTSPPSVRISGVKAVLKAFRDLGLERLIRTKEEPDKEAIRREPEAVAHVKGVSVTQREEFFVKPFESQIERARARKVS